MNRRSLAKRIASPARGLVPDLKKTTPEKRTTRSRRNSAQGKENEDETAKILEKVKSVFIEDTDDKNEGQFRDETALVHKSAVEAYFMQGKVATDSMNKAKVRRGRKAITKPDENMDDESEEATLVDSNFLTCNLVKLRDFVAKSNANEEIEQKLEKFSDQFEKWKLYLAADFNLLFYGVGSKKTLLDSFVKEALSRFTYMRVDAKKEEATIKNLLSSINTHMKLGSVGKGLTLNEWAKDISKKLEKANKQLILVVDNVESNTWRKDQETLCALLENRKVVKLVASVDHVNSTLIWNSRQIAVLNLLHIPTDTFQLPIDEMINGDSKFLGLDSKSTQSAHSMSSLDVFWKSMSQNSRKIFRLFFEMFYRESKPIMFWDLFSDAKDDFLVSTEAALRTQLVEFKDHRLIRWTRSDDGNDQMSSMVEKQLIVEFFNEKGVPILE